MPRQTPAAWRTAMDNVPGLSEGMTSPWIWLVMLAASRNTPAASMVLKPAQGPVAPVSVIISAVKSAAFEAMMSAAFSSKARLSPGPVRDQAGKAAWAAATAALTSSRPEAGAREAISPLNGSIRSNVLPDKAPTFLPPMICWISCMSSSSTYVRPLSQFFVGMPG